MRPSFHQLRLCCIHALNECQLPNNLIQPFCFPLQVMNSPQQTAKFNLATQYPYYKEVLYKPKSESYKLGMPVVFDMDMSAGDFLALFYLLKVPVEKINLKVVECVIFFFALNLMLPQCFHCIFNYLQNIKH